MNSKSKRSLFDWLKRILVIHLLAVVAQAGIAGMFMSGNDGAVAVHVLVAKLVLGICILQIAVTVVLRRRGECPNWVLASALAILLFEGTEVYFGVQRVLVLHIPIAFGIFGGIMRQAFWAIRETRPAKEVTA